MFSKQARPIDGPLFRSIRATRLSSLPTYLPTYLERVRKLLPKWLGV